eukprot:TRINITY_DN16739_c0_g1_i1.p1 TRINITY_DN16739_c0_g1~~TRINITY_DN16739_c0_g1_i1.p1  ORF type:complete len:600 (-),score=142.82 TRINITY_DN16739_c0_g1_i1:1419-3218(-)
MQNPSHEGLHKTAVNNNNNNLGVLDRLKSHRNVSLPVYIHLTLPVKKTSVKHLYRIRVPQHHDVSMRGLYRSLTQSLLQEHQQQRQALEAQFSFEFPDGSLKLSNKYLILSYDDEFDQDDDIKEPAADGDIAHIAEKVVSAHYPIVKKSFSFTSRSLGFIGKKNVNIIQVTSLDVDVIATSCMHIQRFLENQENARNHTSVILLVRDERVYQLVEAGVLLTTGKCKSPHDALNKVKKKLRFFSTSNSSVFVDDCRVLRCAETIVSANEVLNSFPPLDFKVSYVLRAPKLELAEISFQQMPNLDELLNRGCRLMVAILQKGRFIYTTLQNGPGLQWTASGGSISIRGRGRGVVTFSGPFQVKLYHVPEDMKVNNPRKLIAELDLHSSVIVSSTLRNGTTPSHFEMTLDQSDFTSSEISPTLPKDFQLRLHFRNVSVIESEQQELKEPAVEDIIAAASTDEMKNVIDADEEFARRLQEELNEEIELEQLNEYFNRLGINPMSEGAHRVRGPDFHRGIQPRERRADRMALPVVTCQEHSKFLSDSCMICRDDFQVNDELRMLPCLHAFHQDCVDRWLDSNLTCPICNIRVDVAPPEDVGMGM